MLFETEKKALNFMKFNAETIEAETGFSPQRAYYCLFCDGWHVTSIANEIGQSKNEQLYEMYKQEKLEKAKRLPHHQEIRQAVQQKLAGMTEAEKRIFLNERIAALKDEIDLLIKNDDSKTGLKPLRIELEALYILRKQCRPHTDDTPTIREAYVPKTDEKIQEWLEWMQKQGYEL